MARDLLKRGLGVLDEPRAATPSLGNNTLSVSPSEIRRSRTAPGLMGEFMVEQSEVHKEADLLRDQLKQFEGAKVARLLDPKLIRNTEWANRHESHFLTSAFLKLKDEISSSGGNIQPIKVRRVKKMKIEKSGVLNPGRSNHQEGSEKDSGVLNPTGIAHVGDSPQSQNSLYEIVYGMRRHRCALELGLPVLALIEDELTEQSLFVEMDRENRNREDLSAWEQGTMYARALQKGLFPSLRQLSAAIGIDHSNVSKAIAITQLPTEIVEAFGSPLNLQFKWSTGLKEAIQKDPEGVLERVAEIKTLSVALEESGQKPLKPPAIYEILISATSRKDQGAAMSVKPIDIVVAGEKEATLKIDKNGRPVVTLMKPISSKKRTQLARLIQDFFEQETK